MDESAQNPGAGASTEEPRLSPAAPSPWRTPIATMVPMMSAGMPHPTHFHTGDTGGTWSSSGDAADEVLSVETDPTSPNHLIWIQPKGYVIP